MSISMLPGKHTAGILLLGSSQVVLIHARMVSACILVQVSGLQLNVPKFAPDIRQWITFQNPDLTR